MSLTIKELRETSTERIIALHDQKAQSTDVGISFYLDELARRDQNEQGQVMLDLTREMHRLTAEMHRMTRVILWATIAALAVSGISLVVSLISLVRR